MLRSQFQRQSVHKAQHTSQFRIVFSLFPLFLSFVYRHILHAYILALQTARKTLHLISPACSKVTICFCYSLFALLLIHVTSNATYMPLTLLSNSIDFSLRFRTRICFSSNLSVIELDRGIFSKSLRCLCERGKCWTWIECTFVTGVKGQYFYDVWWCQKVRELYLYNRKATVAICSQFPSET